jgi:DUF2075 family protein
MVESEVNPCKQVALEKVTNFRLTCEQCGLIWGADVIWEEADECVRRARCASSLARSIIEEHTRPSCYRTQQEVLNLDVYTANSCARG